LAPFCHPCSDFGGRRVIRASQGVFWFRPRFGRGHFLPRRRLAALAATRVALLCENRRLGEGGEDRKWRSTGLATPRRFSMHAFGPKCPVCDKPIPIRWRLGLRKSWGACESCGIVLHEAALRKVICSAVYLIACCFIAFGDRSPGALAVRGVLGLASVILAHLILPGFEVRDERR